MPDFVERGAPLETPVKEDHFLYLTKKQAIRARSRRRRSRITAITLSRLIA